MQRESNNFLQIAKKEAGIKKNKKPTYEQMVMVNEKI